MEVISYKEPYESIKDLPVGILVFEEDFGNLEYAGGLAESIKRVLSVEDFKGKEDTIVKVPLLDGDKVRTFYIVGPVSYTHLTLPTILRV